MPTISTFRGITVAMHYDDHPPPHFHARHGEHEAAVTLMGELLEGSLPAHSLRDLRRWARMHPLALLGNWNRARSRRALVRIRGLE